jgi:flavin reductase
VAPFDGSPLNAEAALIAPRHADSEGFKEALARLAGGVAIITCWDGEEPHGLLVSSITGLSLEPPRFLFCVRKEASSHDAFLRGDLCGVTILSDQDHAEAQTFIQPDLRVRRFKSNGWRLNTPRPPLFEGGLSFAVCVIATKIDAGTHTILIATAQTVAVRGGEPLLAFNRGLRTLSPPAAGADPFKGGK